MSTPKKNENSKKETTTKYEEVKAEVFEFEKRNRSKLVAFVSKGGWWKMGGNSALFYYHHVAKRIGASPNLNLDRDFYYKFKTGVVSIKDIKKLTDKLAEVGITLIKDDPTMKIFDLGQKIEEEQVETMKKSEDMKRKKVNQTILPKVVMPDIYVHLTNMNQMAYNAMNNATPAEREYLAMDMAKEARDALMDFIALAKGDKEMIEGLEGVMARLSKIDIMLKLVMELRIWKLDACVRFTDALVDTKNLIGKEIEKANSSN